MHSLASHIAYRVDVGHSLVVDVAEPVAHRQPAKLARHAVASAFLESAAIGPAVAVRGVAGDGIAGDGITGPADRAARLVRAGH